MATREQLRRLSIRARVAYCVRCLELATSRLAPKSARMQDIIAQLWKYTSATRLDDWTGEVELPWNESDLVDVDESGSFIAPSYDELGDVAGTSEIATARALLYGLIDATREVCTGNLFSGTRDFSPCTLDPTLTVVDLMQRNGLEPPPIERFARSTFDDDDGWGFPQSRDFFV